MSPDNQGSTVARTKLLHSSLKSIPLFCSIFSACGKKITQFLFSTLHRETFFYTGKNKNVFGFL